MGRKLEGEDVEAAVKKWMRLWEEVGERILRLPSEQQAILLSDFQTAVESRLRVMEKLSRA